jgi:uncharacterized protein YbjQ (UPF0145 family)
MPRRRGGDPQEDAPENQQEQAAREALAEEDAERSLERLQAGDIPLNAERRLRELSAGTGTFTSDLSVAGFALCHQLGLRPLAQVMGSSIYQIGFQPGMYGGMMGGYITELSTLSQAWNEARRLAFDRLSKEAEAAGAQAVVGVQIRTGGHDFAAEAIEYVVVGTAVRERDAPPHRQPVLTELTVADYANLLRAGYQPAGVVAETGVFWAAGSWLAQRGGMMMGNSYNYEFQEFTQAVYAAREQVMSRIAGQAERLGAQGVVGVRIGHRVRPTAGGGGMGQSPAGAMITFDAIGTAVHADREHQPLNPETIIDLTT